MLLLYTDGVIEARRQGEFFGEERLQLLLEQTRLRPEQVPAYVLRRVLSFSGGVLNDDVAVLALSLRQEGHAVGAVG